MSQEGEAQMSGVKVERLLNILDNIADIDILIRFSHLLGSSPP
jgi:hypothetical protein